MRLQRMRFHDQKREEYAETTKITAQNIESDVSMFHCITTFKDEKEGRKKNGVGIFPRENAAP